MGQVVMVLYWRSWLVYTNKGRGSQIRKLDHPPRARIFSCFLAQGTKGPEALEGFFCFCFCFLFFLLWRLNIQKHWAGEGEPGAEPWGSEGGQEHGVCGRAPSLEAGSAPTNESRIQQRKALGMDWGRRRGAAQEQLTRWCSCTRSRNYPGIERNHLRRNTFSSLLLSKAAWGGFCTIVRTLAGKMELIKWKENF